MTVTVPLVALIGVVVYIAYRYMGMRFWHALIAAIFGFLLAATTAAPEIQNILTGLANWLNKP
jgi:ABC-type phosphate transport system auxiliary subunit